MREEKLRGRLAVHQAWAFADRRAPTRTSGALHRRVDELRFRGCIVPGRTPGTPDPEKTYDRAGPDEVDSALDRMLLTGALAQLSPDHRAVIRRSYYQGWTTAQIAADLDIAEGTVKSRLHYAVRALRLSLQEMGVTR